MKRDDLNNLKNSVLKAIDKAHQAIDMASDLMHLFFYRSGDENCIDDFSKEMFCKDTIKRFPALSKIEIGYTEWEDERYSVSYFLASLSELSDYFITMKVLIKGMLSSFGEHFDVLKAVNFCPCLLHLMHSVAKLAKSIEDEHKSMNWEYEDMREYEPYNRVKRFIYNNLSYYAKKHQLPVVNDFCEYVLKNLEKFADRGEADEFDFEFFYPGKHDSIQCEYYEDSINYIKIVRYGWDDGDPIDGGLIEWWSYTLFEDGSGKGEIWWGNDDITEEIDNGMQLAITQPSEFWYGNVNF